MAKASEWLTQFDECDKKIIQYFFVIIGYFPGSFSALHFWTSPLPNNEIEGLSTYYKEILKSDGTEPLLSVRHLRELVPQSQRQCFIKPQYLSHIYAEQKCG